MVVKPTPTPPPAYILRSIAMALAPPPDDWTDTSLDTLILRIQQHAGPQGYAVLKGRIVAFKDGLVRKAWLRYNNGATVRTRHGASHVRGGWGIVARRYPLSLASR